VVLSARDATLRRVTSSVAALDVSPVRLGRARGRYFRENFAQGGVDLVQVIPELVTNADAAITASGRESGQIWLALTEPDAAFLELWRTRMRAWGSPALSSWRHELRCTDDGEGVDAAVIDGRLGALGVAPPHAGQRGLFGRGLRDVWLAQGAGRIEGVRDRRAVESWFFPAPGDDPYAFAHVADRPATAADLRRLGVAVSGTRVTVPLAQARLPPAGRLRALVCGLVQLRPVLQDQTRAVYLQVPGQTSALIGYPAPEPDLGSWSGARPSRYLKDSRVRPAAGDWRSARGEPRTKPRWRAVRVAPVPGTSTARCTARRSNRCSAQRWSAHARSWSSAWTVPD
jgi:hypothetical protein